MEKFGLLLMENGETWWVKLPDGTTEITRRDIYGEHAKGAAFCEIAIVIKQDDKIIDVTPVPISYRLNSLY